MMNDEYCECECGAIFWNSETQLTLIDPSPLTHNTPTLTPFIFIFISSQGPFGGFAASVFKRSCGVKDFSNLIPGHGGVTDRLDCQVIVGGFTWLVLDMLDNV